jgi:hypothetical protein
MEERGTFKGKAMAKYIDFYGKKKTRRLVLWDAILCKEFQ